MTPARAAAAALVAAVAAQFVPVTRDNPPDAYVIDAPAEVRTIIERSCYDCHSNHTRWPWYSRVAPVSWLVGRDVHRARKEMNFTDWPQFDFEEQEHLMADIAKNIERGKMPLAQYLIMHPDARLSLDDRQRLLSWARGR
jgi:hypothetical protein